MGIIDWLNYWGQMLLLPVYWLSFITCGQFKVMEQSIREFLKNFTLTKGCLAITDHACETIKSIE